VAGGALRQDADATQCGPFWAPAPARAAECCGSCRSASWLRGLVAASPLVGAPSGYSQSRSETRLSGQKRKTRFQRFVPSPCNLFSLPGWFVWIIIFRCAGTWDGATSQQTPLSAAVWSATGGGERLQPPGAACDRSGVRWRTVLPDCASRSARTIHPLGKGHHKPILPWDTKLEHLEVREEGRVVGATRWACLRCWQGLVIPHRNASLHSCLGRNRNSVTKRQPVPGRYYVSLGAWARMLLDSLLAAAGSGSERSNDCWLVRHQISQTIEMPRTAQDCPARQGPEMTSLSGCASALRQRTKHRVREGFRAPVTPPIVGPFVSPFSRFCLPGAGHHGSSSHQVAPKEARMPLHV
jgi:hypothetical protein